MKKTTAFLIYAAGLASLAAGPAFTVDAGHPSGKVSPRLYGLMTEEINHSYDGGLYAELIQNRTFQDNTNEPVHWSVVSEEGAGASIALDATNAFNDQHPVSLRVTVTQATKKSPAGVANSGYWGVPVQPRMKYRAAIWAKAEGSYSGPVTVSIVSDDRRTVYAKGEFSGLTTDWKKFELSLEARKCKPTKAARFVISVEGPGTIWLGMVSLFPPTWKDQPNGFRKDLMQMLVDLNPKFLRFPGGNYVEGDTIETRFDWKKTIGPIDQRPGHACPWGYRSTDGMGLLEFLEWCEDMKAEPVLAVYGGYSLRGMHVNPGVDLQPFVQEALEEIEYVTGDVNTRWGARRAKDGHPAPFKLSYVEVGNEDWFDRSRSYGERFAQFYDAIKARYPGLKVISTIGNEHEAMLVHNRKPDALDEHYYSSTDEFLRMSPGYARKYSRSGPEIFVGEWAAHEDGKIRPWSAASKGKPPTPSMKAAIGDGVFMAAMERNSDVIQMQCYAPLFVNVSPGARQWRPDLIGYDALTAYGSPSYYALQMFSRNLGDEILPVEGVETAVQGTATRDSKTGEIFLKLVNPQDKAEALNIECKGVATTASKGSVTTLAASPEATNSIEQPREVIPVTKTLRHVRPAFTYTLPPHSVVLLKLRAK